MDKSKLVIICSLFLLIAEIATSQKFYTKQFKYKGYTADSIFIIYKIQNGQIDSVDRIKVWSHWHDFKLVFIDSMIADISYWMKSTNGEIWLAKLTDTLTKNHIRIKASPVFEEKH